MEAPVDLANLHEMTDGDIEMETALFQEFFLSFEDGIKTLRGHSGENAAEIWRKQAHALKGIALNLGANRLGELCKKAQEVSQALATNKDALLKEMDAEYTRVHTYLNTLTSH